MPAITNVSKALAPAKPRAAAQAPSASTKPRAAALAAEASTKPRVAAQAAAPSTKPRVAAQAFTISELAVEFDITSRAIRFYEDVGLLTPGRAGRNRVYTQRDRTRLKLTLRGKRLGLSLQEIKQLVDMYDSPSDTTQQLTAFLGVLGEHRRLLEQQREDIEITLAEIAQHEERCRKLLGAAVTKKPRRSPG